MYPNMNKLNSNRDMSPNKMVAKNKPLLAGNNGRAKHQQPINYGNGNYKSQMPFA